MRQTNKEGLYWKSIYKTKCRKTKKECLDWKEGLHNDWLKDMLYLYALAIVSNI